MAMRIKKNETRHWPIALRGWLGIHAAKRKMDEEGKVLASTGGITEPLPYGAVVCILRIVGCERTELLKRMGVSEQEQRWGNYSDGRWAWITSPFDIIEIPEPIPLVGHQGLFRWHLPPLVCERIALIEAQSNLFDKLPEQINFPK